MDGGRKFGEKVALMVFIGNCSLVAAGPLDACWYASFKPSTPKMVVLSEDQDEGTQYFSFEKLEYGLKSKTQDSLIRINKLEINLSEIKWKFRPSIATEIKINNNDVNTMLAEASKIKAGKIWYCLSMPFNGLGSNGNFAKYKVVLAIPKNANYNSEIFGMVGSNMSSK